VIHDGSLFMSAAGLPLLLKEADKLNGRKLLEDHRELGMLILNKKFPTQAEID